MDTRAQIRHSFGVRTLLAVALLSLGVLGLAHPAQAQQAGATLDSPAGSVSVEVAPTRPVVQPPASYGPGSYGPAAQPPAPEPAPRLRATGGYSPTWAALIPGLAAFLVPYVTGALAAAMVLAGGSSDDVALLFVPVGGAFYFADQVSDDGDKALFAAMGISELAGAALIVLGLAMNRRPDTFEVSIAPLVAPGLAGLSARGRF